MGIGTGVARDAPTDGIGEQAQLAWAAMLRLARRDCPAFCEMVLRDEETGNHIQVKPFQAAWHYAIERYRNVVIWAFPESGKTQQLAIARVLWLLGKDQRRRYAVLSATQSQAKKIIRTAQQHIIENQILHQVFPDLRRGTLWTDVSLEVERPGGIKDPSLQAYSPEGGTIQGARLDGLIIDDVLTENNTRTNYQRDKIEEWIRASAFPRLAKGAWVCLLTNAWHPKDMAHNLERQGWHSMRFPVLDQDGKLAWPERWPLDRIEHVRTQVLGPIEFSRQMLCQPRDESTARFQRSWIEQCLALGEGFATYSSLQDIAERDPEFAAEMSLTEELLEMGGMPAGFMTITGVDLAISARPGSGKSALFTLLLWPNGMRQVLEVQAGRWSGPEIIDRVVSVNERFRSTVVVENNAAQDFLVQWVRERAPGMRVRAFTTGRNKLSPEYGVESLAAEMAASRWLIPCEVGSRRVARGVADWIDDMLAYDPQGHTGDRLMASWIAREAARMYERKLRRDTGRRASSSSSSGVRAIG
jgi:hypothetical protein